MWSYFNIFIVLPPLPTPGEWGKVAWPPPDRQLQGSCWSAPRLRFVLSAPPPVFHSPPPSAPHTGTWQSPLHPTVSGGSKGSDRGIILRKHRERYITTLWTSQGTWQREEKSARRSVDSLASAVLCLWTSSSELTSDRLARTRLSHNKLSSRASTASCSAWKQ